MAKKARHAFGSEANVDAALQAGTIDAYDILFLDEKKIGWIDKNGQKVIVENPEQVLVVTALPETGKEDILYVVVNNANPEAVTVSGSIWDETGNKFVSAFSSSVSGMDEAAVDSKIEAALEIVEF